MTTETLGGSAGCGGATSRISCVLTLTEYSSSRLVLHWRSAEVARRSRPATAGRYARAMRICIVYDCLYPHTVGGAERWYRNLAERLAADGHEVTYLTLRQWDDGRATRASPASASSPSARGCRSTPDGRRRIGPPLVFGLGVLRHLLAPRRRATTSCTRRRSRTSRCSRPRPRRGAGAATGSSSTGTRSGRASYWHEYLGPLGGRDRLARCSASACASRSGRSASRGCTSAGCARRASAATVTRARGRVRRRRSTPASRSPPSRSSCSPAATSRRSACRARARRSRGRASAMPGPARGDLRRRAGAARGARGDRRARARGRRRGARLRRPASVVDAALRARALPRAARRGARATASSWSRRRRAGRRRSSSAGRTTRRWSSSRTASTGSWHVGRGPRSRVVRRCRLRCRRVATPLLARLVRAQVPGALDRVVDGSHRRLLPGRVTLASCAGPSSTSCHTPEAEARPMSMPWRSWRGSRVAPHLPGSRR